MKLLCSQSNVNAVHVSLSVIVLESGVLEKLEIVCGDCVFVQGSDCVI